MKTIIHNNLKRGLLHSTLALFMIFTMGSCAKKIVFPVSAVVPAASASVTIKNDKNKNYALTLTVKHLAGPERLTPAKQNYVVWIEAEQKGAINIGRINISKGLTGTLKTTTPFKPTVVFVTAEDDPNIKFPGMQVVIKTDPFTLK